MYFDLFLPFPIAEIEQTKKKKDKGKGKATQNGQSSLAEQSKKTCWDGLRSEEKDAFARDIALAGHRRSISATSITINMLIVQWDTL